MFADYFRTINAILLQVTKNSQAKKAPGPYNKGLQEAFHNLRNQKVIKNYKDVSDKTEYSKSTVSEYLNGTKQASEEFVRKFENIFQVGIVDSGVSNNNSDDHGTVVVGSTLLGATTRQITIDDYIKKIEEHNMFLQDVIRQGLVEIKTNLREARQDIDEIEISQRVQHTVMLNSLARLEKKDPKDFDKELSTLEQASHQLKNAENTQQASGKKNKA